MNIILLLFNFYLFIYLFIYNKVISDYLGAKGATGATGGTGGKAGKTGPVGVGPTDFVLLLVLV